jgi:uncharacterized membrane protein
MTRTTSRKAGRGAFRAASTGRAARALSLAGATITTGLASGVFYAYAISVSPGLRHQPDAGYVATMQAINREIQNPLFFASFFGAVVSLLLALVVHSTRPGSARWRLISVACVLYVGGGFVLTVLASVPLNEELTAISPDAPASELARARAGYEDPWNFWNGTRAVSSSLAFLALVAACLSREPRER